jgi:hypothetical protein
VPDAFGPSCLITVVNLSPVVTTDAKIQDVAVRYIRQSVGGRALLPFESLGTLHPALTGQFTLQGGELVLTSAFFSTESWYVFTTRRIVSLFAGVLQSLDPSQVGEAHFPNFKGSAPDFPGDPQEDESGLPVLHQIGLIPRDIATLRDRSSRAVIHFEYQTCQGSGPPMYAVYYWWNKHPFLDKLMTNAELEHYKTNISGPRVRRAIPEMPARQWAQREAKYHAKGVSSSSDVWHELLDRATPETLPGFLSEFTPAIHDYLRQVALPTSGALLAAITDWYDSNAG